MLEFIVLTAIVYLLIMGLVRLFQGKQPKREIYIIREYEIKDEPEQGGEANLTLEQEKEESQQQAVPGNVVPFPGRKRTREK